MMRCIRCTTHGAKIVIVTETHIEDFTGNSITIAYGMCKNCGHKADPITVFSMPDAALIKEAQILWNKKNKGGLIKT